MRHFPNFAWIPKKLPMPPRQLCKLSQFSPRRSHPATDPPDLIASYWATHPHSQPPGQPSLSRQASYPTFSSLRSSFCLSFSPSFATPSPPIRRGKRNRSSPQAANSS